MGPHAPCNRSMHLRVWQTCHDGSGGSVRCSCMVCRSGASGSLGKTLWQVSEFLVVQWQGGLQEHLWLYRCAKTVIRSIEKPSWMRKRLACHHHESVAQVRADHGRACTRLGAHVSILAFGQDARTASKARSAGGSYWDNLHLCTIADPYSRHRLI